MFLAIAPSFSPGSYRPGPEKCPFHQRETTPGAELEQCRVPQQGRPFPCTAQHAPTDARTLQQPCRAHPAALAHIQMCVHTHSWTHAHSWTHTHTSPDPLTRGQPPSHRRRWVHMYPSMPPAAPGLHPPQRFGVIKVPFEGAYNFYLKILFQDNFQGCKPGTKRLCEHLTGMGGEGEPHSQKVGATLGPKSCLWPHWSAKPGSHRVTGSRKASRRWHARDATPAPTDAGAATWVLPPPLPARPRTQQTLAGLELAKMKIEKKKPGTSSKTA